MGGEYAMTTDTLPCANLHGTSGSSAVAHNNPHVLRYDNLTRILIDLEKRACVATQPKRRGKLRADHRELAELQAHVVNLRGEYERIISNITDDLEELAVRIAELEARAQPRFWRRAFGHAGDRPEVARRARRKLLERLRSIFFCSAGRETPIRIA